MMHKISHIGIFFENKKPVLPLSVMDHVKSIIDFIEFSLMRDEFVQLDLLVHIFVNQLRDTKMRNFRKLGIFQILPVHAFPPAECSSLPDSASDELERSEFKGKNIFRKNVCFKHN